MGKDLIEYVTGDEKRFLAMCTSGEKVLDKKAGDSFDSLSGEIIGYMEKWSHIKDRCLTVMEKRKKGIVIFDELDVLNISTGTEDIFYDIFS